MSASIRETVLNGKRLWYQYDYTHVSPLAIAKWVPIHDDFSLEWLQVCSRRVFEALANRAQLESSAVGRKRHEQQLAQLNDLFKRGASAIANIKNLITGELRFEGRPDAPKQPAKSLKDYAELFRDYGLPPIAKDFAEDRTFAAMRVAGPNPVMLQQLTARDARLPLTDAQFQIGVPGDSLDAALAEGRLYLADYALLDGAEMGTYPNGQKYLYAPLALFVLDRATRQLRPVAIQCRQKPADDVPVFTPDDGYNWLIAKTIVEIADANIHEASTHLGRTHLLMEPFVVTTHRQLAPNHPLSLLLWPHFEGTLAINGASWQHLIAEKGGVDKLFGGSIKTSRKVVIHGVQSVRVMDDRLPLTFARRGVADREAFPDYPYRDDALLYWNAVHEWVDAYLRLYYKSDTDILGDFELRAWASELVAKEGGRLQGLPNDGSIRHVEELVEVATFIIYTCSVQHAAVNFPQYDCMSYVPNMPLAGYRPAPTSKHGATEADFIAMLPPLDMAELQMDLGCLLGRTHYTELGQYAANQFRDPQVAEPLSRFQSRLKDIGTTIAERNRSRRPYDTLAPKGIPQSINI